MSVAKDRYHYACAKDWTSIIGKAIRKDEGIGRLALLVFSGRATEDDTLAALTRLGGHDTLAALTRLGGHDTLAALTRLGGHDTLAALTRLGDMTP